ncbi:DUF6911 family protein [Snodgrassella alvi]|uniref:DUF6911 family protein n=1 Tax=Snodgrassella alvi TaxID=1196083 RepID=UPI000C1ED0C9|nr:hypothetical protein [Snodgrassella alvi]PIT42499.1 hypothetical protein BHC53_00605 [Snodgrassella alvi]
MKTEFKFNGKIVGDLYKNNDGIVNRNPTLEDINNALDLFASGEGVLYLIQNDVKGTTPYELTLYADKGKYLVMFSKRLPLAGNEDNEDNEDEVRTFMDRTRSRGMVDLQGDLWDNRIITEDFTKVRKAFNEFYLTGDIDRNLVE